MNKRFVIVGGGAAGFFGAIRAKETHPDWEVVLLEKGSHLLAKVKVSGGRRCNVTHACFEPNILAKNYPRGHKELIGPFHRFQPKDTVEWFKARAVELKTEEDGRMFPITDSSQTIVDCLLNTARKLGVIIRTECELIDAQLCLQDATKAPFSLILSNHEVLDAERVLLATGGNAHSKGWALAKQWGHSIEEPVPSLFTFNIEDPLLKSLQGISMPNAEVSVPTCKLKAQGPLLITHWGLSGPGILKLSAWGARQFFETHYHFTLWVDWLPQLTQEALKEQLLKEKQTRSRQQLSSNTFMNMPQRLWEYFLNFSKLSKDKRWADLNKQELQSLLGTLKNASYSVTGKSTHKEEFVTCGGIRLSEVNFKTMESKLIKGLYFAGEALDIDGITGGFNFQAAWTTSWIAGSNP